MAWRRKSFCATRATVTLRKIGRGPARRIHSDRRQRTRGIGGKVLHLPIDDATRLVYREVLSEERPLGGHRCRENYRAYAEAVISALRPGSDIDLPL